MVRKAERPSLKVWIYDDRHWHRIVLFSDGPGLGIWSPRANDREPGQELRRLTVDFCCLLIFWVMLVHFFPFACLLYLHTWEQTRTACAGQPSGRTERKTVEFLWKLSGEITPFAGSPERLRAEAFWALLNVVLGSVHGRPAAAAAGGWDLDCRKFYLASFRFVFFFSADFEAVWWVILAHKSINNMLFWTGRRLLGHKRCLENARKWEGFVMYHWEFVCFRGLI